MVGARSMHCCSGRGICTGNPVLPLDQFNPSRTGTNPEHCHGSIAAARSSARRDTTSFFAQNATQGDIARASCAMKHANNIPRIQCLLSLPRERNRNCEEPVKGQARWCGSLRSPLTEPSQFLSNPPLMEAKEENRKIASTPPFNPAETK